MSIRCSLLGHSYGEVEIEREREEQGSEVVVTVREFEECERCGDQNVVSENKEVTALQSPAPDLESAESDPDVGAGADASAGASTGGAADVGGAANTGEAASAGGTEDATGVADEEISASGDDAEILTDSPDDGGAGQSSESGAGTASPAGTSSPGASADSGTSAESGASANAGASADSGTEAASSADEEFDSQSAADDDGVILDDGDATRDDGERQPGEWPAAETTHSSDADEGERTPWPDVGREDEGFDAEPGGGSADVEFGGGLTPESAPEVDEDEADEVEFVNAEGDALRASETQSSSGGPELSSGISAGAEAPSLSGPADDVDVDAEFVCPECDYRKSVAGSSLRAGDICPECSRGYLAQE